jgi:hypothetical protein
MGLMNSLESFSNKDILTNFEYEHTPFNLILADYNTKIIINA